MLYVSVNQVWAANNVEFTLDERANQNLRSYPIFTHNERASHICPANYLIPL